MLVARCDSALRSTASLLLCLDAIAQLHADPCIAARGPDLSAVSDDSGTTDASIDVTASPEIAKLVRRPAACLYPGPGASVLVRAS